MGKIKDLLGKAVVIGNEAKFRVKVYWQNDEDDKEVREMTYIELGMFLVSNREDIGQIDVLMKLK